MNQGISADRILQLGLGFWGSRTLLSAVELGLFTELASGPKTAGELQQRLGLRSRSALDFLDALVALGMLQRSDGRYSNTPETAAFLDRSKPEYVGGVLDMLATRNYGFWHGLTEALRSGQPQNEIKHGGSLFETLYSEPERLLSFLEGMTGISLSAAKAIARKFPWREYRTFVDIGAAQGAVPVEVAIAHSHLRGSGFDLPVVEPIFREYVSRRGVDDRVAFIPGDFFKDSLPRADVLIMGHILHDWDLDQKKLLLTRALSALPPGGSLIVYEAIIDDDRRANAFGLLMSLNMLIETTGGFDYTGADCQTWMREVGFSTTRVEHLAGHDSMVIGVK
jgi:hypothetical protein